MEEDLNLEYISNYGIDEFNMQLVLNPSEVAENEYLQLMEAENPSLPMLCSFAKGLFYIGKRRFSEHIRGALENVLIIDPHRRIRPTVETVRHLIRRISGELEVWLEFRSHSEFIWASDEDDPDEVVGVEVGTLDDIENSTNVTEESLLKDLFRIAKVDDALTPMGEPADDGEFVCSLRYTLYSVNGFKLNQTPVIKQSADDLEFVVSGSNDSVSWPGSDTDEFDWVDLLSQEDRVLLMCQIPELLSHLDTSDPGNRKYRLLTVQEIHRSYSNGEVKKESPYRLQVVVGFGARWSPELRVDDIEDDEAIAGDLSFPSMQPPLFEFNLPLRSKSRKKDFKLVFPALRLLLSSFYSLEEDVGNKLAFPLES